MQKSAEFAGLSPIDTSTSHLLHLWLREYQGCKTSRVDEPEYQESALQQTLNRNDCFKPDQTIGVSMDMGRRNVCGPAAGQRATGDC